MSYSSLWKALRCRGRGSYTIGRGWTKRTSRSRKSRVNPMARVFVSAAHKSSGRPRGGGHRRRLAQARACRAAVQEGTGLHRSTVAVRAAGRDCHNLDFHTMGHAEILAEFARRSAGADLSLVEGNKGLHDGVAADGADSNAALAKLLAAPVVLVVDTRGITRGSPRCFGGYRDFDPDVWIAGVVLNQVGGERQRRSSCARCRTIRTCPCSERSAARPSSRSTPRISASSLPPNARRPADGWSDRACIEADVDLDRVRGSPPGPGRSTRFRFHCVRRGSRPRRPGGDPVRSHA